MATIKVTSASNKKLVGKTLILNEVSATDMGKNGIWKRGTLIVGKTDYSYVLDGKNNLTISKAGLENKSVVAIREFEIID